MDLKQVLRNIQQCKFVSRYLCALIFLLVFCTSIIQKSAYSSEALQGKDKSYALSTITCGSSTITIKSYCSLDKGKNTQVCGRQNLVFSDARTGQQRKITFKEKSGVLDVPASEWACRKGRDDSYIELSFCLWGDCEIVSEQRPELWSTSGRLLTPKGKGFDLLVKKLDIQTAETKKIKFQ